MSIAPHPAGKRPHKPALLRPDGEISRPDAKDGSGTQGNPLDPRQRKCKYQKCTVWFTPQRSTKEYHSEACRKSAYQERRTLPLEQVLEELAELPDRIHELTSHESVLRILELADRAAAVLKEFRKAV